MNISVIIPVHEYDEKVKEYLDKALESIAVQDGNDEVHPIFIVIPEDLTEINDYKNEIIEKYNNVNFVLNNGNTSYQSQVNLGVDNINTDYFTVLEYDDELSKIFFKNAYDYINAYPDIDIFMNLMIEVNENNDGMKLTNETVWSQQFVGENGEIGYLNSKSIKQYTDFKLSGAIIKKSEFKNIGGYKSNIKMTFMYEFLLRALNAPCKIYTIPKVMYKHLATRENSLFDVYAKTMPIKERKFWFDTALNECNFNNDRIIDLSKLVK